MKATIKRFVPNVVALIELHFLAMMDSAAELCTAGIHCEHGLEFDVDC